MKVLIALSALVAAIFAAQVPQLQSGLLVLPKQGPSTSYYPSQRAAYNSYNQQEQSPDILSPEAAGRRGVYFVQVPQERIQALKASQQYRQNPQAYTSGQYKQEQSSLPTVRYLPIQLEEDSSQYSLQQQREEASGFVANVQYSQVEPIQGPVYSYGPQQLTRILRYAPAY